jgi:hypothetical protein
MAEVAMAHLERGQKLPGGSEMTSEVSTPSEGHAASGARSDHAVGSVVIFHGRVEPVVSDINDGPPLGSLHGSVAPLPKDQ